MTLVLNQQLQINCNNFKLCIIMKKKTIMYIAGDIVGIV